MKRPRLPLRLGAGVAALAAPALLGTALSACTSTLGYAAVVNGSTISQDKLNQELADISANPKYVQLIDQPGGAGPVAGSSAGSYNKSFVAVLLDQQVRFEVIRQALGAAKALPGAAQVAAAKTAVSQAFPSRIFAGFPARYQTLLSVQQAEADAFVKAETLDISNDGLNQYYQAHQSDYATEACVRHILIADRDTGGNVNYTASVADAQKVKALLDAGGDFAALAKQYSQDNQGTTGGSAAQGGMLTGSAPDGCLTPQDLQQLITEFAKAVVALPVNQVSNPVRTQFGYHLIEVTKRAVEPLDSSVASDIRQRVAGQRLNSLVAKAKVKVNPAFGTFDNKVTPSGQVPGVVPPLVPGLGVTTGSSSTGSSGTGSSGTGTSGSSASGSSSSGSSGSGSSTGSSSSGSSASTGSSGG